MSPEIQAGQAPEEVERVVLPGEDPSRIIELVAREFISPYGWAISRMRGWSTFPTLTGDWSC